MISSFTYRGKVYSLKPKFITNLQNYIRKVRLGLYKKKKVNESKTEFVKFYHMKFKIHIDDDINPQVSNFVYEMVVPAKAPFFAKALLERSIQKKLYIDVLNWDEMSDEELDQLMDSKKEFVDEKLKSQTILKD